MSQTAVIETTQEVFDFETGEVSRATKRAVKKTALQPTDEYVKVSRYLNVIFAYMGIPLTLIPISLLIAQRMEYKTNVIHLLKEDKVEIGEMLGHKQRLQKNGEPDTNTVDKLIRECVKYDILRRTKTRGRYEVNGYLFSTGSIIDTRELQAKIDFDRDIVITSATMHNKITGETVRKAITNRDPKQIPGQMNLLDYNSGNK